MNPAARSPGQIARSRGIGAGVGAGIGAAWLTVGLLGLPMAARVMLLLPGLIVLGWLLRGSLRLIASARRSPPPTADGQAANRRAWGWFWINFLAEIVLLNVAVNLLNQPALRIYWIPAISLVVGLHFLPMAIFLGVPSYWTTGGAMIGVAALTALALGWTAAPPGLLIAGEEVANATILWATAAWAIRPPARQSGLD